MGIPSSSDGKRLPTMLGEPGSIPGSGRPPGEETATHSSILAWKIRQPTPVFLPGKSHGLRSLAGYSPWGHKEPDTIEATEHAQTLGGKGE